MDQKINDNDCASCKTEKEDINKVNASDDPHITYGAQIGCAFKNGEFSSDNWNCGTLNRLIDIAHRNNAVDQFDDVTVYRIPVTVEYDMLSASDAPEFSSAESVPKSNAVAFATVDPGPSFIILTKYKSRGHVSSAVVCGDYEQHLTLTQEIADSAISEYNGRHTEDQV